MVLNETWTEAVPRLTQVGRALTYATSLDETLRLTVECAADLLRTKPVLLLLKNKEGTLEVRAGYGFEEGREPELHAPMDELLIDRLRAVLGPEASDNFVGVPLVVAGEVTGLLVASHEPGGDADRAEWLLSTLADQASLALETSRNAEARAKLETKVETLEAASGAKDHALRVISHDLRTPLSTIVSYTELLDSGMLGPVNDRQRAAFLRMKESGEHLIGLLQNVLEMTRLTAGAIQLEPQRFDLVTAVHESVDVAVKPRGAQHEFEIVAAESLPVFADPVRVRQVLIHLIDNAIKYTPPGTRVRIICGVEKVDGKGWGVVYFTDDGPGISAEVLPLIFQPYQRGVDEHQGPIPSGSGLGLAIAKALVEQMAGSIEVHSTPGAGTTFTIRLPLSN